jgi:hypothetical protein
VAAENLDDAVALVDREWRAIGVVAADRAALARDLRLELAAAAADGVPPASLLGPDARAFARDVAAAAGATRLPHEYGRLLTTALAGALPALLLGWLALWWSPAIGLAVPAGVAISYGVVPPAAVLGALLAVSRRMRGAVGRTVAAMAVLVPLAVVLATPVTVGFAALTGYSTAMPVLATEVGLVAGALAGAVVLARRWALAPALRGGAGQRRPPAAGATPGTA